VSEHLGVLLDEHQPRWQERPSYFYADSGSSAGKFINRIEQAGFTRWSVSYNKWTDKLDRFARRIRLPPFPMARGEQQRRRGGRRGACRQRSSAVQECAGLRD